MNDFIRLNIAIVPPKDVSVTAIDLSKKLSSLGKTSFVLDGKRFHPHITCYSPEFPRKNLDKIYEQLEKLTKNFQSFENDVEGLLPTPEPGGVEVKLKKTTEIDELHREIIDRLNPLREGHLRDKYKDPNYPRKFPKQKRKLMTKIMKKVGYPRVLGAYNPHISITRFESSSIANKGLEKFSWDINSMKIEKIGVFTMGEFGTCTKLLNEFLLCS